MEFPKVRLLTYGDPGSGKTHLAGTFTENEETAPVMVLNSRGQPVTFNLFPRTFPFIYDIGQMTDYNLPYSWIKNGQPWDVLEANLNQPFFQAVREYFMDSGMPYYSSTEEERKFRTVVLDSLTQTQRISLGEVTGNRGMLPGDRPKNASFTDWGSTLAQMTNLADLFFQLPLHVVVTSLRRHQYVESQGLTMYYPFFWGQSSYEVPGYAEIVGMLVNIDSLPTQKAMAARSTIEEGETAFNVLLTQGGRSFQAKWQGVRNPPAVVVNPTATKLLEIMNR